jgi:hypothetical protein
MAAEIDQMSLLQVYTLWMAHKEAPHIYQHHDLHMKY